MTIIIKIMPKLRKRGTPHAKPLVAVLAYDGVCTFELGIAVEVFGLTGMGTDWYRVVVCSDRPHRPLRAKGGVWVMAEAGLDALARAGTIIVPGWQNIDARPREVLLDALQRAHKNGSRIASICSGVFVLAATGLLDGRRAAVHWANAEALATRYPLIRVDASVLYVDDGELLTSAGRAAGLDLCLHIVRRDHGIAVANQVARRLVIAPHRDGGQAQFIPRPVLAEKDAIGDVFSWARQHLEQDLSIASLAARVRMSRRTFIRRFEEATGVSPGKWVLDARLAGARQLLESSNMSIERIAIAVGFGSADALRHHFRSRIRTSPTRYRFSFRE
jgi:AraC family transcriptional regulator, transcriptional activator FtrA